MEDINITLTAQEKRRLYSQKRYNEIKNNPEKQKQELERIKTYHKNRYNTDEEYKNKKKEQVLNNYYKKKTSN